MINVPLLIFIAILLIIIFQIPIVNLAKSSFQTLTNSQNVTQITLLQEQISQIDQWYNEAKYFRCYNKINFAELKRLLRQYRHSIKSVSQLEWENLVKHKQMLHILVKKIINCFHSTIHSLPKSDIAKFDSLLKQLQVLLSNLSYYTIVDFYKKNPRLKEFSDHNEIHVMPDWYINYGQNPEPFDMKINYNYDWA